LSLWQGWHGKTTLLRRLLNQMATMSDRPISTPSFFGVAALDAQAFGLEDTGKTRAQLHQIFVDYLIGQYAKNRRTMLIIDEAQNMSSDALEELRMLSNINSEKDLLLQVILVGQSPLRDILRRPELEQFAQRIAVDYHLESLSQEETRSYIRHRIIVAGGEHDLFSEDACDVVFEHCSGIPRLINLLCDYALVYAYASQAAVVTSELVEQVLREREKYGALPVFAVTKEDRVKQNLPVKETRPLKAAKLPATSVAHANRKMAASRAMNFAGSAMLTEGCGKTVNSLPPSAKHESDVETKIRAGTIDASHTKTSVTSLVEDASVVTPLNVAGSYKVLDGIETERLPLQTLPSKRQVEKPDLQPDESAQADRNRQTKPVVPPSDYSGDAQRAKLTDAGIAKSSSVLDELWRNRRQRQTDISCRCWWVLLSIALIWFFR
jgi:type II secretory pathway predicted ATPase ExeA